MEVYPREPRWALNPSPRRPSSETRQRQLSTDSAEHQRLASPRSAVSQQQDSSHARDARDDFQSAAAEAARGAASAKTGYGDDTSAEEAPSASAARH